MFGFVFFHQKCATTPLTYVNTSKNVPKQVVEGTPWPCLGNNSFSCQWNRFSPVSFHSKARTPIYCKFVHRVVASAVLLHRQQQHQPATLTLSNANALLLFLGSFSVPHSFMQSFSQCVQGIVYTKLVVVVVMVASTAAPTAKLALSKCAGEDQARARAVTTTTALELSALLSLFLSVLC